MGQFLCTSYMCIIPVWTIQNLTKMNSLPIKSPFFQFKSLCFPTIYLRGFLLYFSQTLIPYYFLTFWLILILFFKYTIITFLFVSMQIYYTFQTYGLFLVKSKIAFISKKISNFDEIFFEGFEPQNVFILFLFFMKHSHLLVCY